MEEWVGHWWHRAVTRAADRSHADAAVELPEVQRAIGLLFRAAGGAPAVRVAAVGDSAAGGPRGWLQKLAGSGQREARGRLEPEVLSLPPRLAVFAQRELNRDLYLWLAALAASHSGQADWIAGNHAATARALQRFAGLRSRHAALVQAHLAQRPAPTSLRGEAAHAEAAVQAALRGEAPTGLAVLPAQVAPVWLWLEASPAMVAAAEAARVLRGARDASRQPSVSDATRRKAQRSTHEIERAPLMMFFRAESLQTWSELVRVNRATDDSDDGHALTAANDMEHLAITPDGETCASRVRFDLDLPSAAADDLPLGPSAQLPEWDWRIQALRPAHCRVQPMVARPGPAWQPDAALRRTARQVRRRLEVLRAEPRWAHAQDEGEALDLDAWVRHASDSVGGVPRSASPAVHARRVRQDRSLATLLLADLSLSTDAHVDNECRVIDVIRDAMHVFGEALSASGDAFEMLGFSSVRREQVRIQHLKGFDEPWGAIARQRVGAIRPGYYTRMGAAIRWATARLSARPERQRLLLLLTDGKPNDLDVYEGRYGLEDTRHAVAEARSAGLVPFCVTIDEHAQDYLPWLFGTQGHARVQRPRELPLRLARIHATLARG
ncbi:nitric oxide reductase activation protein NorD [Ideonella sp. A 288]|uniref:nitric oxide reductase activation protein NorD n=1 Tax=Ideonella sp. A 288 TaxID=1962181 RepID=UPI000B4C1FC1|nr:VWA domain-containing protein [Ideonella sp. A 288]